MVPRLLEVQIKATCDKLTCKFNYACRSWGHGKKLMKIADPQHWNISYYIHEKNYLFEKWWNTYSADCVVNRVWVWRPGNRVSISSSHRRYYFSACTASGCQADSYPVHRTLNWPLRETDRSESSKAQVNQSLHRRLRLPSFETIGTWRWSDFQPYAPAAFTPQGIFLVLISVTGWVDPRVIVRPEGLCQWNIPMTPSGIELAAWRLLVQWLNQLRHYVRQSASSTKMKNG